jgi:hypothetical protein
VTKFTSSVGKGLSAATLDAEYQTKRRMTQRRNKPKHALYGVAAGASAFADSVTSAFEGIAVSAMPMPKVRSRGLALTVRPNHSREQIRMERQVSSKVLDKVSSGESILSSIIKWTLGVRS